MLNCNEKVGELFETTPEIYRRLHREQVKVTYILEATVKDLQLFAGEACLSFELLQALWAMAYRGEFQLIFNAVWRGGGGGGRSGAVCKRGQ